MYKLRSFFFFFLFIYSLSAQDFITSVSRYDQEDGLSHNQVHWAHKDSRGMMWIGASNGINRYDGQNFKLVAPMELVRVGDQNVVEDKDGDLWVKIPTEGRRYELVFFNTITEEVKTFEEKFEGHNIPFNKKEIIKALIYSDNSIIIGTDYGKLIHCDTNYNCKIILEKSMTRMDPFKKHDSDDVWVHCRAVDEFGYRTEQDSEYISINEKGEIRFRGYVPPLTYSPIAVSKENKFLYTSNDNRYLLEMNDQGNIDSTSFAKLTNGKAEAMISVYMNYDPIRDMFWYNKYKSFYTFNIESGLLPISAEFKKKLDASEYFNSYVDEDYYWLGTIDGLLKIQLKESSFQKLFYQSPLSNRQGQFNSCRGFDVDEKGNIYIGTRHGLFALNSDSIRNLDGRNTSHYATLYDKRGYIWVGINNYLHQYDLKTGLEKHYQMPSRDGVYEETWAMHLDENNRLWLGMGENSRMCYLEDGAEEVQVYGSTVRLDETKATVYDFFEDRDQQLWLVRANGLFKFDTEKGISDRYWPGGDSTHYLPSGDLRHVLQDKDGIYWLGTSAGLIRWDKKNLEHRLFTTADGFSHNHILAVYEDDFGFLWMSSDNGIMQFEKSTFRVRAFLPSDGISHREFNRISHFQSDDGKIYFGGMNGVTYFHPKDFVDDFKLRPDIPLVLTDCQLFVGKTNRQESRLQEFRKKGKITIAPGDRYLKFDFALLDYKNSEHIQYAYTIDDEQWNIGKDRSINIGALPYGKHLLTIKGKTANGMFSKQELSIPITVLKPFYLQYWFIALVGIALVGLVFLYQKRKTKLLLQRQKELEETVAERTHTVQKQAEELLELDKTKSRFLANISHELRTPLTLVLNAIDIVDEKITTGDIENLKGILTEDLPILKRNSHRLQSLIEQLLDLSKLENGKMKLQVEATDFHHYLKELVDSFEPLAAKKNIELQFIADIEAVELYFDRDKMDKIIYNLLYNAIKFTPSENSITIKLQKKDKNILVTVQDTGLGIAEHELENIFTRFYQVKTQDEYAHEGTGLGLALVKEFTELHSGKVTVRSRLSEGTAFRLSFPLGKNHFHENDFTPAISTLKTSIRNKVGEVELEKEDHLVETETTSDKSIILFIEDNEDLRHYQQKRFEDHYTVLLAKDGLEGLEMAFEHIPDVIICDVMMPGKNGYEVSQTLKNDERTNHIPIILLTAKAAQEEKIEGLKTGADDYMVKPYDQRELQLRVENMLRQIKRLQQQYRSGLKKAETTPIVEPVKNPFLSKMDEVIETNISSANFGVLELSEALKLSRSQLFRKVKALTGNTPTNYLRSYRLRKAKQLLLDYSGNASEVSYQVGFKNPSYFFKCFKDEFGVTPSEMLSGMRV